MTLKNDKEINDIYDEKYPNNKIYPCALLPNEEQEAIFYFDTTKVTDSKFRKKKVNLEIDCFVINLRTNIGFVKNAKHTLVFPKKTFVKVLKEIDIDIRTETDHYHMVFVKRTKRTYVVVKAIAIDTATETDMVIDTASG